MFVFRIANVQAGVDADRIGRRLIETFSSDNPPASQWIDVQALAQPEYLLEVEAMAAIAG